MENCACIQGDFRFTLDVTDCAHVYYKDASRWQGEMPDSYEIRIVDTRGNATFQDVSTRGVTKLEKDCHKDGYYEIHTESCGVSYVRPVVILCNLECCFLQAVIKGMPTEDLFEVRHAIEAAKRQGIMEDQSGFEVFYHKAKTLLKSMACNCHCQ